MLLAFTVRVKLLAWWKSARVVVLLIVLVALVWISTDRVRGLIFRSSPMALETAYLSEAEWVTNEIVRDVTEMVGRARHSHPTESTLRPPANGRLWHPEDFAPLVRTHIGETSDGPNRATQSSDVHHQLTDLRPAVLVRVGNAVSNALALDMRDAAAHEAAALVVGAFAFREAAGAMTDVRWALNRMTAHLAMAAAIRRSSEAGDDGRIAAALLLMLSDRQTDALMLIDTLSREDSAPETRAWARALRTRITDDWRLVIKPATATRVEKLAYLRARRAAVGRASAAEDLRRVDENIQADWARIVAASSTSIEDGHAFVATVFDHELAEIDEVHGLIRQAVLPDELHAVLNVAPASVVNEDGVHVLPWSAWAQFFQRHLAAHVGRIDGFYRHGLGMKDDADQLKDQLDALLGELQLFPLGAIRRTTGKNGAEADLAWLSDAISFTSRSPESVTRLNWTWMEFGQQYEPSIAPPPSSATWFAPASEVQPFEAAERLGTHTPSATLDKLLAAAPYNHALLINGPAHAATGPRTATALSLLRAKAEYDLRAMDVLADAADTDQALAVIQRQACKLSPSHCLRLAWTLVRLGETGAAVAEFTRAFADADMDIVEKSQQSWWLVNHYYQQKRIAEASALADEAASVYSYSGLITKASLSEHLGRYQEAEDLYRAAGERYERPQQLLGFLYRQAVVRDLSAAKRAYEAALRAQFPHGLQPALTMLEEPPRQGVYIYTETPAARRAGLRVGDIIVGLEGWRVDNVDQYMSINAFFAKPEMKIALWRGKLLTIETVMPGRLFGVDLKSYPLQGWIERK